MGAAAPLVRVVRSGLEESVHLGHVAVCDADGRLVASAGDPHRKVFARSSMKPVQAAVSLAAIGEALPDRMVAVMCASHNGEPVHVAAVRSILAKSGVSFSALRCPPGWPLDAVSMARAVRARRELNNCSGKHAGMVFACMRSGWDPKTYLRASHPLQRRVLRAVRLGSGLEDAELGVDGCGVPVYGMPLAAMATIFARLSIPERWGRLHGEVARCVASMRAEPYLVAGRDRTDTAVMVQTDDVVVKSGFEGLACASILGRGLGVAVKVADGSDRASGPALIRALALLDALSGAQLVRLAVFAKRPLFGGGNRVGDVIAEFDLGHRQR